MKLKTFVFNPFQENTYLLYDETSHEAIVIDPGMSNEREWLVFNSFVQDEHLNVGRVLLTHCHVDHIIGTGLMHDRLSAVICGPVGDEAGLPSPTDQSRMFGLPLGLATAPIEVNVNEGDVLMLGSSRIEVFDVPGHSHHGLCYYLPAEKLLFSGDVLFYCSVGRSDFGPSMGGNHQRLIEGILTKLMALPADVGVYPGHGPMTSIAREQNYNPYF